MVEALGVSIHVTSALPLEEDSGLVGSAPNESGSDGARPATGLPIKESKVIRGLLNCILSGVVTSPSTASIAGVPEKAMFLLLPLPPVVDAVRISGVCWWKGTGLRPEDPRIGRESIPVGPSEYLAGKSGHSANDGPVGMEPTHVRLNLYNKQKV